MTGRCHDTAGDDTSKDPRQKKNQHPLIQYTLIGYSLQLVHTKVLKSCDVTGLSLSIIVIHIKMRLSMLTFLLKLQS